MTVKDLMAMVERLHPNQFGDQDKLTWLNDLERKIWDEVIMTHQGPWNPWEMPEYSDVNDSSELLATDTRMYPFWMDWQIAY